MERRAIVGKGKIKEGRALGKGNDKIEPSGRNNRSKDGI